MRVWTVSSGKAGTLTQCLGVAEHLDPQPYSFIVKQPLKRWQIGPFSPHRGIGGAEPDLLVSCGVRAEKHVFAIARRFRNRPFRVHLQTPRGSLDKDYDRVFVSRHDWTEEIGARPNFRPMIGVPHRITAARLVPLREEARRRFLAGRDRAVTFLIGGSSKAYQFDPPTIERLLGSMRKLAAEGWRVLASTSRRSESVILERLKAMGDRGITVWDRTGENPYLHFLAAADAFAVTKDSLTMHCEALASGRPVYTFDLARQPGEKIDSFEWFHRDMSETLGLTRPFDGQMSPYEYEPPDEARRIAEHLRGVVELHRKG